MKEEKEEIKKTLAATVKALFGKECDISFNTVTKNNNLVLQAIIICEPDKNVTPSIYIDGLLGQLEEQDITFHDAARKILSIYTEHIDGADKFSKQFPCINKDFILDNVVYQLVNAGKNVECLADMPHKGFLDLAAIYRAVLSDKENKIASMVINNRICDMFSVSEEELDEAAKRNTEKRGFCVRSMASVLSKIMDLSAEEERLIEQTVMYVMTNDSLHNGASILLYKSYLKKLADDLESDLYILPSSIHEVLAVPVSDGNPKVDYLKQMVREVNVTQVTYDEVLSDNVYRFIRGKGELVIT